jgi:diguanylate cyclase
MADSRLELRAGERVFSEGDPPTCAYLIESGHIEIVTLQDGAPLVLSVLGEGDLLGEMAIIDAAPRTATARALTDSVLIPVDGKQLSERIESSDPIVRALLKGQLTRYRQALLSLRAGHPGALELSGKGKRFVDGDGYDDGAVAKIRLETQLRDALSTGTLEVRFQPIYDIAAERIAGYEALVRWTHPVRGPISPAEFISLAEETSLILPVGQYVLDRVAEGLAELQRLGVRPLPFVAVNMSGRQLGELDMLSAIRESSQRNGIDPRLIKIEVTESLTLDVERVGELIRRAEAEGMMVALDDFGTGHSNLGHLHKLRFNTIKLDQGFVRQMLEAPRCHAVVRAIVAMVHALEADLVAEGVETRAQLDALAAMKCKYAQGYLIGRPQTFSEMLANHPLEQTSG